MHEDEVPELTNFHPYAMPRPAVPPSGKGANPKRTSRSRVGRASTNFSLKASIVTAARNTFSEFRMRAFALAANGWAATIPVVIIAALLRLIGLNRIQELIFDETYYVKDAYALAHLGYEAKWADNIDAMYAAGDFSGMRTDGSFVVHPQVGKWLIAEGMSFFGWNNPVGWRISAALAGIVGVILVCRLAWHIFHSSTLTALAGLFLATDGIHLVMSRTGLLDIFVSTFTLAAFLCVILDQQKMQKNLPARITAWVSSGARGRGPSAENRWWLLAAGILLGLACASKWSAAYAVGILGIFIVIRDWSIRRSYAHPHPFLGALATDTWKAFLLAIPATAIVYVASWWSWFANKGSWGHTGGSGFSASVSDFLKYHHQIINFHIHLTAQHPYASHPAQWFLQLRPTSFAYSDTQGCGGTRCLNVVLALGNPIMWWLAAIAVLIALVIFILSRDWHIGIILCGYIAMYLPWFQYAKRPIFNFYTVAFVPYVALILAWAITVGLGKISLPQFTMPSFGRHALATAGSHQYDAQGIEIISQPPENSFLPAQPIVFEHDATRISDEKSSEFTNHTTHIARASLRCFSIACIIAIVLCAIYFYPIWTGLAIPYDEWRGRMWFNSWI